MVRESRPSCIDRRQSGHTSLPQNRSGGPEPEIWIRMGGSSRVWTIPATECQLPFEWQLPGKQTFARLSTGSASSHPRRTSAFLRRKSGPGMMVQEVRPGVAAERASQPIPNPPAESFPVSDAKRNPPTARPIFRDASPESSGLNRAPGLRRFRQAVPSSGRRKETAPDARHSDREPASSAVSP